MHALEADRREAIAPDDRPEPGQALNLLSVVTPAYKEAANLPVLYERLSRILGTLGADWEWIVVDDHSPDATFGVITEIARRDPRVRGIRLARNSGSHAAMTCGLHQARGNAAVIMAADLQDPPETLPAVLQEWSGGAHVVWAVRGKREGESLGTILSSRVYYALMRHAVGMKEMPATGADFFLVDRRVLDSFQQFNESNVSIYALITWMGFRQTTITYDKQARLNGTSGWNLAKKIKLVIDSVTSFSYFPIRLMSAVGLIVAVFGFLYAAIVLANAIGGHPTEGWTSLMVVVLVIGGIQMLMLGILGEYLWRGLEEARRRPRYLIEASTRVGPRA